MNKIKRFRNNSTRRNKRKSCVFAKLTSMTHVINFIKRNRSRRGCKLTMIRTTKMSKAFVHTSLFGVATVRACGVASDLREDTE